MTRKEQVSCATEKTNPFYWKDIERVDQFIKALRSAYRSLHLARTLLLNDSLSNAVYLKFDSFKQTFPNSMIAIQEILSTLTEPEDDIPF